jgi:uncharacterized RDD family membrane protein YckC
VTTVRLAGFATRAVALALDGAVLAVIATLGGVGLALAGSVVGLHIDTGDPLVAVSAGVWWALVDAIYLTSFWRLTGQTPGMRVMGLRVIDRSGAHVGAVQSLKRLVGMVLSAIPFGAGFLLVLVDDRRQGLHDHLASTLVIYEGSAARAPQGPAAAGRPDELDVVQAASPGALRGASPAVGPLGPDPLGR